MAGENSGHIRTTATRKKGCGCGRADPCAYRPCMIVTSTWHEPTRGIRVGGSHIERHAGVKLAIMCCHTLTRPVFACLLQLLLQTSLVHSATIPDSLDITSTNASLSNAPVYCNDFHGWVGNGFFLEDCAEAITEFYRTNVEPRGMQKYEFYTFGVPTPAHLPNVVTPRKHDYGQ